MWKLDYKESWAPKNWCFWTVMWEKTLESPLDNKEIKPVNPKGNQSWIFIESTDAEAPILWPPAMKSWLFGKDPDAGKDWSQEEKGMTEGEMVGWHRWLNGHEFERAPEIGDGQGGLACCSPWGHKELDVAGRLNWADVSLVPCLHVGLSLHKVSSSKQDQGFCTVFLSVVVVPVLAFHVASDIWWSGMVHWRFARIKAGEGRKATPRSSEGNFSVP